MYSIAVTNHHIVCGTYENLIHVRAGIWRLGFGTSSGCGLVGRPLRGMARGGRTMRGVALFVGS